MTRRHTTARLVPLATAMKVLGGHHPIKLGIGEALPGVFDLFAIHAALDRQSGLSVQLEHVPATRPAANDDADTDTAGDAELAALARRIQAHAARRT